MPVIPYTKNTTWADGSGGGTPDTASKKNLIEDGIYNAHLQPAVRVTHNAAQSIPNTTETVLAFNTERFDTAGGAADTQHDTVTNNSRLTCKYAGIYQITGNAEWASSPTSCSINIRLNGTTKIGRTFVTADNRTMSVSTLYQLAVNDYVELTVNQNSGAGVNINSTGNYSPEFMMVRVA